MMIQVRKVNKEYVEVYVDGLIKRFHLDLPVLFIAGQMDLGDQVQVLSDLILQANTTNRIAYKRI